MRWGICIPACLALIAIFSCSGRKGPEPVDVGPAFRITIDSTTALNGQQATVSLRHSTTELGHPIDSISGYDFLVAYDASVLSFLGSVQGIADSSWEYFTWRHDPQHLPAVVGTIHIIALRDLENGAFETNQRMPLGELLRLVFQVTSDRAR